MGVFATQFFNTAFLLLLCNANLSEQMFDLGLTVGNIPDFNMVWFVTIGNSLVSTILYIAYWPIIEFFGYWAMRVGFRILDRGLCNCDVYKTKKSSLKKYIDLYAGPYYYIHYKYSAILNITFCTFMYGFAIPILFPIALVAFLILYIIDIGMLYYSYRLPPSYDDYLSNAVLQKLKYAPLFYFAMGYWMLSSNQLCNNFNLEPVETTTTTPLSGHLF
eukprot:CAMPEP_0176350338 /NCGR_PEP_ID=MMETSP0126-20121128/9400_1 /TAXON_ID=141414 ORGANISM="Strombidinopsis acuminatum, Strain SPMC142" /NCGR_SAMPLE_ID=MMETSP0126 /ASSEMBLY_ACC=CAM_ASM_000229 /LENGTH=217 /DNA_ID=CAMNT_0017700299 /DNA_START=1162 /DNA_END=1815 /DNA_ORIENTATION=+